ncbi:6-carboxyhexanoate--CoA ligase [Persephonella atlantica]|uniref:6-carboxyhexanoate--CoA ligase n=1 Tax=Persephonella atlantica TaxID=2699429 RepID=A0ABS1GIY5_9AQUI|nr:6-carboxyhexanoate--CoA ligase [Persephonella atlantica]MBK3332805.1 6-carboxyhexanoate--CoA ligase [Persephonella atlantica]
MKLFSVKGRSSLNGKHQSGAERIASEKELDKVLTQINKKITRKPFDYLSIKVSIIKKQPPVIKTLKIVEIIADSVEEATQKAVELLHSATGLSEKKIKKLIKTVHTGASPDGNNMRGAMIVNQKGERIELDPFRGVRTTEVDFIDRDKVLQKLKTKGYTERTLDALAISSKNMSHPDMLAEFCISDEPDYLTGYIATKGCYYRLTPLKEKGNPKGGRIYFVKDGVNIENLYNYLEKEAVLIEYTDTD